MSQLEHVVFTRVYHHWRVLYSNFYVLTAISQLKTVFCASVAFFFSLRILSCSFYKFVKSLKGIRNYWGLLLAVSLFSEILTSQSWLPSYPQTPIFCFPISIRFIKVLMVSLQANNNSLSIVSEFSKCLIIT